MNFADLAMPGLADPLTAMPDPAGATQVTALEDELATRFNVPHAVAVSSGTAALHLALKVLGIGPGDEVLVPALSVVMSVAPVVYLGARPIFVDCNPDGTDFDYHDLNAKITHAAKAVLPVHLWGRAGDLTRLCRWADEHHLDVVEDACQAQGTDIDAHPAGTRGAIGCFSMKDGKILWSGEGGYLLVHKEQHAAAARSFRSHGQPPPPTGYPPHVGHNYRLAEPLAAIARANLSRFDQLLGHRQDQARHLREHLTDTPGIAVPQPPTTLRWNGYSFLATVNLPAPRAFCEHLARLGVPNSVGTFRLQPADQRPEFAAYTPDPCPNAAAVIGRTLAVVLTDHDNEHRIAHYAQTIAREAHRWQP
ncbi:aminotransferase class I/II-fold pyridoxal phosphate-dependent enzyme [Phytohabitans sp. ZYX-F-186]|uniref:Aminotransferase class I/II-fold pyridoxal phosphate-dependent enzyme n=1 Tax=Phytohabitans maris TaxID=3071409 RepID=A0ABU0ZCB3_9ACTN|nr:aminotransferase class I/II-fold pyridoxal phosphate-dependent enzyme [Phytohabitans sp. ZYX-F-186]MDQ7904692.1 aminotransferase class I/II-fold pyridoxal phosphate-dependent enzyme [Phytohabitans sp. ZYX-F-186]